MCLAKSTSIVQYAGSKIKRDARSGPIIGLESVELDCDKNVGMRLGTPSSSFLRALIWRSMTSAKGSCSEPTAMDTRVETLEERKYESA